MRFLPRPALAALLAPTLAFAQARDVRVCAGGDVTLGSNVGASAKSRAGADGLIPPDALLAPLRPLLAGSDLVLLNVEGAIGEGSIAAKCRPGSKLCYQLRQPTATAAALVRAARPAIFVGNVANNHSHDAGGAGFLSTLRLLESVQAFVTGADTLATAVEVAPGDTIGVLGFSAWTIAGVTDLAAVRRHVARAVARYHRVIVTMHLGAEGQAARHARDVKEVFAGEQRGNPVQFARTAAEAGASMVIGHGPHVLRAVRFEGRALVAYSLGNLLTYGPFNVNGPNGRAVVLCATLKGDGSVRDARAIATQQRAAGMLSADSTGGALRDLQDLLIDDFPRDTIMVSRDGTIARRPR